MQDDITSEGNAYRSYFNAGVSQMMSRMWGGHLHMGLFENESEPLEVAQLRLKDRIGKSFGMPRGSKIFEAACGVGTTAIFLARAYGLQVHATNISEEQIQEARQRASEERLHDTISFEVADYHHLSVPTASFDGWLCQEALLYAKDRSLVFSEALRVVRPGGRIVFSDLTLNRDMPAGERDELTRIIRAPYLWPLENYSEFIADLNLQIVDVIESRTNVELTFKAVLANLAALEEECVRSVGLMAYREAETRIFKQYEAAKHGNLSWCFYCLQLPDLR
jgi:cyclopropane fatty-acyl-phospholipid synthase-like methyltransferase